MHAPAPGILRRSVHLARYRPTAPAVRYPPTAPVHLHLPVLPSGNTLRPIRPYFRPVSSANQPIRIRRSIRSAPARCSVPDTDPALPPDAPAETIRTETSTARSRRMTIVRIRFAPNSCPAPSGPVSEPRTATIPRPQFAHPPQRPPAPPQRKTVKTGAQRTIFPINSYICNRLTPSPKWI